MVDKEKKDPATRPKIIVTTVPFATLDPSPIDLLREIDADLTLNPLGRRLQSEEVENVIRGHDVIIAGTETIPPQALDACPEVRAICRVGIGLDGVPLLHCREKGIAVSYTPDGPSLAVAELTIGLLIDTLRGVGKADRGLREGRWERITGRRLGSSAVGIIGMGRIGTLVARHLLSGFPGVTVLASDIERKSDAPDGVEWVETAEILKRADAITLHVPLTRHTKNLISKSELEMMKPSAVLINTARGGIINEADLHAALRDGVISAAAIDTFVDEPYTGPLRDTPGAVLTCHMGSMTRDCRIRMEREATMEAIRFLTGEPLRSPVPETEFEAAADFSAEQDAVRGNATIPAP